MFRTLILAAAILLGGVIARADGEEGLLAEVADMNARVADLEERMDDAESAIDDVGSRVDDCSCDGSSDPYEEPRELSPI